MLQSIAAGAAAGAVGVSSVTSTALALSSPLEEKALRASALLTDGVSASELADDTATLQSLLDSTATTVVIDNIGRDWITRPLFLNRSNVTVILEPGVIVRALAGGYPGSNDCMLTIQNKSNVHLRGYGATLVMNKPEYTTGEHRMVLQIRSCSTIWIEGLTLKSSGGDGIYLGVSSASGSVNYSSNVVIRDVLCDDNKRNGLSVISVNGLLVEGSAFINTTGTPPQNGIDLEPNSPTEKLVGVTFRDCYVAGNAAAGTQIYGGAFGGTIGVVFERSYLGGDRSGSPACVVVWPPSTSPLTGTIEIRDSLIENTGGTGMLVTSRIPGDSTHLKLTRAVVWSVGNAFANYYPFTIRAWLSSTYADTVAAYGGWNFTDVSIITDLSTYFLRALDGNGGSLTNVTGNLSLSCPAGLHYSYGANPTNVTLAIRNASAIGRASVSVAAGQTSITRGTTGTVVFTRSGGDLAAPLAIRYSLGGTARARYDIGGLPMVAVIPPSQTSVSAPIRALPRWSPSDPASRTATITISAGQGYVVPSNPTASVLINE